MNTVAATGTNTKLHAVVHSAHRVCYTECSGRATRPTAGTS